jgi:hypothetical protein
VFLLLSSGHDMTVSFLIQSSSAIYQRRPVTLLMLPILVRRFKEIVAAEPGAAGVDQATLRNYPCFLAS